MDAVQPELTVLTEPTKIFIACIGCKARKRKCDGGTPKCSGCVTRGLDCSYAAVRKSRGQGKKKTQNNSLGTSNAAQNPSPEPGLTNGDLGSEIRNDIIVTPMIERVSSTIPQEGIAANKSVSLLSAPSTKSSSTHITIINRIPIFPDFLLPGTFDNNLKAYKRVISEAGSARSFTPLIPLHISKRLIQNSFAEIMQEHQIIDLSSFLVLLSTQYDASSLEPGDNPARWALVNSIMALAVRAKTAPGSESTLFGIANAYYQNATRILSEIILQDPNLLSIQALLSVAMLAQNIQDIRAFIMLATNASRQLELLNMKWFSTDGVRELGGIEQYEQIYRISNEFGKISSRFLNPGLAFQLVDDTPFMLSQGSISTSVLTDVPLGPLEPNFQMLQP